MVSVALSITDDLRGIIEKLPWVNWSEIAREEIEEALKREESMNRLKAMLSKSKLTEAEAGRMALEIGKNLKTTRAEQIQRHSACR
jgi:hypothetical protein